MGVRPGDKAPRKERIDHMCTYCGRITEGPHAGKRVSLPSDPRRQPKTYYGAPISHGACDPACKEMKQAMRR